MGRWEGYVSVILWVGWGGGAEGVGIPACITGHMTNNHYISSCIGVDFHLVLGQHTDNFKCIMVHGTPPGQIPDRPP